MKTITETFQFFIKCLEEETTLGFAMEHWYSQSNGKEFNQYGNPWVGDSPEMAQKHLKDEDLQEGCGTAACIAGTVAFNLDKRTDKSAYKVVYEWVREGKPYAEAPYDESEQYYVDECTASEGVLDTFFTTPEVYGYDHLKNVTKVMVIHNLQKAADQCEGMDWQEAQNYLLEQGVL